MFMKEYFSKVVDGYKGLTRIKSLRKVPSPHLDNRSLCDEDWQVRGVLADDAATILMQVFHGARISRWELIQATSDLQGMH